jgi:glycosyltransferase involved in cell wall biosynthesis
MTQPRVLHIELGRHRLGGTMQVFYLHRALSESGIASRLITPESSVLHQLAIANNLDVTPIRYSGDADVSAIWKIAAIVRNFSPNIVHIHSRRGADVWGAIAARLASNAKIITARRVDDPIKRTLLNRFRYGPLCDHIVAVSQGIVRALEAGGVSRDKISQVYSAIEAQQYQSDVTPDVIRAELGLHAEGAVLAVIAQLIERKGHRFLLAAMAQVLQAFPQTQLLFLGEGALEENLRARVSDLGLTERVVFAGYRDDVGRVLQAIDILIHPATMEGFANVAMQAGAAEKPVITTDVGGMPESVADKETGLVVPPQNPNALAEAIISLLADPTRSRAMGAAGKQRVESRFTIEAMVSGTLEIYQQLLNSQISTSVD